MRKEVLFAIFAGVLFGLVIAFGVFRANTAIKSSTEEIATEKEADESQDATADVKITIAKPDENDVVDTDNVLVSGITSPNTNILISTDEDDYIFTSDNTGAFEKEIELSPSLNNISISAYSESGLQESENLHLVYSTEFFKQLEPDVNSNEATEGAQAISQNVERKLDLAANKPKALSGVITDITNETLQIRNTQSEIQQVSIGDETSYVDNKKESKDIKFEDVAIGDYVVCLGFTNGDSVLKASRVIVTNAPKENDKNIFIGKYVSVDAKEAIFSTTDGDITVLFPKSWNGPEIGELLEGQNYLVVAINDDGVLTVRTIQSTSPTDPTPTISEN